LFFILILFSVLLDLLFQEQRPLFGLEVYYLHGFLNVFIIIFILGFSFDVIAFIWSTGIFFNPIQLVLQQKDPYFVKHQILVLKLLFRVRHFVIC